MNRTALFFLLAALAAGLGACGAAWNEPETAQPTVRQAPPAARATPSATREVQPSAAAVPISMPTTSPTEDSSERPSSVKIDNCLVSLIEEAQVPAQEAGVLMDLMAREGTLVQKGDPLALIDDTKSKLEVRVAQAKYQSAKEKADDDINVIYSRASAEVAKAEYEVSAAANRKVKGAVPEAELRRLELKVKETELSIEKARMEKRVAGQEANVALAEVDAAQENIRRRQIRAPLDGVVVQLHRHAGEWVQPGDAVMHVVRMDRLWVEGFVSATQFNPREIQGRDVAVRVKLARGQQANLSGKVVFVKPIIEAGSTFLVRAEVRNEADQNGAWVLSPGLNAEMTIQLQ